VLATQYEEGGSAEWGGRYFALGLPLAVPVALHALRRHGARLVPADRRVAVAALATVSCLLSVMAIASLAAVHHRTAAVVDTVDRTAAEVVVTTVPALPRLAWQDLGDRPWLLIGPADRVPEYLDRLRDRGAGTIAYATRSFEQEERLLDGYEVVAVDDSAGFGWRIATVRLAP
jgi:hypothetical protein